MLALDFGGIIPALLIPLACILILALGAGSLLADAPPLLRRRLAAAGAAALVVGALAIAVLARYPDLDESEHLHTSWLMAQGQLPFRDFFQHHTPTFWLTLAPLMRLVPPSGAIFLQSRLFSVALGILAWLLGYGIARRLHGPRSGALVAPVMALLAAGSVMSAEYFILRPDLISNLLSLLAIGLMLGRTDLRTAGLSGLLLGLSVSYNPKHWPLALVLPAVVLSVRGGFGTGVRLCLVHALGGALGALPLLAWLWRHDLVKQAVDWVVDFNGQMGPVPGGSLPLICLALAAVWAWRAGINRWQNLPHAHRVVAAALVASALIGLLYGPMLLKWTYHLQVFIILASAVGAVEGARFFTWTVQSRRGWLAGLCIVVCLQPLVKWATLMPQSNLLSACRENALLQQVAQGEPVLCVPPRHPIFAPDATYMQQPWQWLYFLRFPEVAERLRDIDDQIMTRRPVLILGGEPRQQAIASYFPAGEARYAFIERFTSWGNLSLPRAMALQRFLEREYHFVRLERHWYWVRRDRALPPEAVVQDPTAPPALPPFVHWNSVVEEPG